MRSTRVKLAAVAVVAVLTAAACGGDDDDDVVAVPSETTEGGSDTTAEEPAAEVTTDFGADDDTIRLGLLADLSGPFAPLVKDIVLAQQVYWDQVNEEGGIAGRQIELVVEDTKYDVPTHRQKYEPMAAESDSGVLLFSQSTGSPHTAALAEDMQAKDLIAIPLTWYSGWADPEVGKNVFETYTNYCFEAMNAISFMADEGAGSVAVVSFPGEYGQDGAVGAKLAMEDLGLELAFDGEGKVIPPSPTNPNPDNSAVVAGIVDSGADWVYVSANPTVLAQLMGQASARGFTGKWSGASPSYSDQLLKSDVKDLIDQYYWQSTYTVSLGTDVPGMQAMIDSIKAAQPDARSSDAYVYGWTEAQIVDAVLREAAESGDMTRAGVVAAAFAIGDVDFGGLAPPQSWQGEPNDYIVRESYIFKPKTSLFKEAPIGEGHTGSELVEGPFASPFTEEYDFQGPCFKPSN